MRTPFEYPKNEAGDPEYGSVIITLDHLSERDRAGDPHVRNKLVMSTESAVKSAIANMGYYNQLSLLTAEKTIEVLGHASLMGFPIIVYQTGQNVQIILSMGTYMMVLQHMEMGRGSFLLATNYLAEAVKQYLNDVMEGEEPGSLLPLFVMELGEEETEEAAVEEAPAAKPAVRRDRKPATK